MKPSLFTKVILFLTSISPTGSDLEELSGLQLSESQASSQQIADQSQALLKPDTNLFAFSKWMNANKKDTNGKLEVPDADQLKELPETAATCCELMVAAFAAQEGKQEKVAKALADEACRRVVELPTDEDADALIVRELSHLLFKHFQAVENVDGQNQMMQVYVRVSLTKFITSPHLIGASIVNYADFLNAAKPAEEKSADYYQKVILDLNYLADDPGNFPHAEAYEALYWLKRAYQSVHAITGDKEAKANAEKVDALLKKEKVDESMYSEPRYGLLAKLYVDEPHFIALVLKQAELAKLPMEGEEGLRFAGHRFACSTSDVEYYRLGLETQSSKAILDGLGIQNRTLNGRKDKDISEALKILKSVEPAGK